MVDLGGNGPSKDRWTCPNDRQLALRAKLRTGWSVKTQTMQSFSARSEAALDEKEREIILEVIRRAESLEASEQQRVGRLVQRLESMKSNAMGNGTNKCVLCGDSFGILGASGATCRDCKKVACQKCGVGAATSPNHKTTRSEKESGGGAYWLCKICAETREMWKKSGAWFFKGLPKYVLPEIKQGSTSGPGRGRPGFAANLMARLPLNAKTSSFPVNSVPNVGLVRRNLQEVQDEESSSEDDVLTRKPRLQHASLSAGSVDSSNSTSQQRPHRSIDGESDRSSTSGSLKGLLRRESSTETSETNTSIRAQQGNEHGVRWADCDSVAGDGGIVQLVPSQASTFAGGVSVRRESCISGSSTSVWGGSDVASCREEDEDIPEEAYLGSMEFSVTYEPQTSMLHCCLHRAKGLRSMDINGLCDPYCRAQLLPVAGGKACAPLRTKTVHKTREPEFNETLAWCRITETNHARKTLHLVLFDEDKYGHEALGAARLHLSRLSPGHTSHFNVFLEKPYPEEVGEEETPGRGRILISLCYTTRRRALMVGVLRCAGLAPMDSNGTSDPFVKLQLRHDPQRRKFKTAIKWRNLNPEFNEEFALDMKLGDLSRRALLITVWDKDLGKANDYLGGLELGFCSKGDRLKQWLDAIKYPDRRHERWHNLTALPVTE